MLAWSITRLGWFSYAAPCTTILKEHVRLFSNASVAVYVTMLGPITKSEAPDSLVETTVTSSIELSMIMGSSQIAVPVGNPGSVCTT